MTVATAAVAGLLALAAAVAALATATVATATSEATATATAVALLAAVLGAVACDVTDLTALDWSAMSAKTVACVGLGVM